MPFAPICLRSTRPEHLHQSFGSRCWVCVQKIYMHLGLALIVYIYIYVYMVRLLHHHQRLRMACTARQAYLCNRMICERLKTLRRQTRNDESLLCVFVCYATRMLRKTVYIFSELTIFSLRIRCRLTSEAEAVARFS